MERITDKSNPTRKCVINDNSIEEFYEGGLYIAYINGERTDYAYSEACNKVSNDKVGAK